MVILGQAILDMVLEPIVTRESRVTITPYQANEVNAPLLSYHKEIDVIVVLAFAFVHALDFISCPPTA
jgi:hypothetical protein